MRTTWTIGRIAAAFVFVVGTIMLTSAFALQEDGFCKGCGNLTMCLSGWPQAQYGWEFCEYVPEEQPPCRVSGQYGVCSGA